MDVAAVPNEPPRSDEHLDRHRLVLQRGGDAGDVVGHVGAAVEEDGVDAALERAAGLPARGGAGGVQSVPGPDQPLGNVGRGGDRRRRGGFDHGFDRRRGGKGGDRHGLRLHRVAGQPGPVPHAASRGRRVDDVHRLAHGHPDVRLAAVDRDRALRGKDADPDLERVVDRVVAVAVRQRLGQRLGDKRAVVADAVHRRVERGLRRAERTRIYPDRVVEADEAAVGGGVVAVAEGRVVDVDVEVGVVGAVGVKLHAVHVEAVAISETGVVGRGVGAAHEPGRRVEEADRRRARLVAADESLAGHRVDVELPLVIAAVHDLHHRVCPLRHYARLDIAPLRQQAVEAVRHAGADRAHALQRVVAESGAPARDRPRLLLVAGEVVPLPGEAVVDAGGDVLARVPEPDQAVGDVGKRGQPPVADDLDRGGRGGGERNREPVGRLGRLERQSAPARAGADGGREGDGDRRANPEPGAARRRDGAALRVDVDAHLEAAGGRVPAVAVGQRQVGERRGLVRAEVADLVERGVEGDLGRLELARVEADDVERAAHAGPGVGAVVARAERRVGADVVAFRLAAAVGNRRAVEEVVDGRWRDPHVAVDGRHRGGATVLDERRAAGEDAAVAAEALRRDAVDRAEDEHAGVVIGVDEKAVAGVDLGAELGGLVREQQIRGVGRGGGEGESVAAPGAGAAEDPLAARAGQVHPRRRRGHLVLAGAGVVDGVEKREEPLLHVGVGGERGVGFAGGRERVRVDRRAGSEGHGALVARVRIGVDARQVGPAKESVAGVGHGDGLAHVEPGGGELRGRTAADRDESLGADRVRVHAHPQDVTSRVELVAVGQIGGQRVLERAAAVAHEVERAVELALLARQRAVVDAQERDVATHRLRRVVVAAANDELVSGHLDAATGGAVDGGLVVVAPGRHVVRFGAEGVVGELVGLDGRGQLHVAAAVARF